MSGAWDNLKVELQLDGPHRLVWLLAGRPSLGYPLAVEPENFSDAALLLVGHGSTQNAESAGPVRQHAAELRGRKIFAEVHEGFWTQEPHVNHVLAKITARRVFIVPLFISEGYFSEQVIPKGLGFPVEQTLARVKRESGRVLYYCEPVGSHPGMTQVLLARAEEVVKQFPFPRAPQPKDITLFIAGHGTEKNADSRTAVERQVLLIRKLNRYAEVHAIFMEEAPRIATCYQTAQTRNLVVVPFFISDGLHTQEDIPVLLGEPQRIVQERLQAGQPTWRNPTEKQDKLVWYSRAVGTEPQMAEVILERVRDAAQWN